MAAPPPVTFDNKIILVTGSPVSAAQINSELTAQNDLGYFMSSLEFQSANNALLLFGKMDVSVLETIPLQKVNAVGVSQGSLDADKATETALGYWPTGIFITPGGALLAFYTLLYPPSV